MGEKDLPCKRVGGPPHFISLLKRQFQENSRRPALIYQGETLTFAQLETKAETVSRFLREKGLRKGDVVILYTPGKRDFLLLHLGIILAGGVSLPLNFNFTPAEMTYFINDSGARFVFASGKQAAVINGIKDRCPHLEKIFKDREIREKHEKKLKEVEIEANDDCFMLYSSGTTGQPKGVVHTHANTAAALLALQKCWAFSPDDVLLNVLPLFHIHGLSFASHLSLISGSAMILKERFHPQQTLEKITDATVFMGVPTYYYAFLNRPGFREKAAHWQSTRLFTCGSAPIRSDVLSDIETIIGKPLINRYGMTESHVITSLPLEGSFKKGSVGLPLEGIHMKIEKGEPRGGNDGPVAGEVKIKSKNLFNRYWNKPGATRAAFDGDGFFCTGDLGFLDERGYLFLVGRKHDLIITGGYNVYPLVVERVINQFHEEVLS
jgi:malonyl-CoA/methylmalonyl-CoA synthetase